MIHDLAPPSQTGWCKVTRLTARWCERACEKSINKGPSVGTGGLFCPTETILLPPYRRQAGFGVIWSWLLRKTSCPPLHADAKAVKEGITKWLFGQAVFWRPGRRDHHTTRLSRRYVFSALPPNAKNTLDRQQHLGTRQAPHSPGARPRDCLCVVLRCSRLRKNT